jgi:predicted AAA+ superfamily ATPase
VTIPKFSSNIDRQAAGSKKLFLCDTGIANTLGKVSHGQLFEQSVFQNLRPFHIQHFYNKDGTNEIDFIADSKAALEVELSASRQDLAYCTDEEKSYLWQNITLFHCSTAMNRR